MITEKEQLILDNAPKNATIYASSTVSGVDDVYAREVDFGDVVIASNESNTPRLNPSKWIFTCLERMKERSEQKYCDVKQL